jgi:hypothetical protein
MKRMLFKKCTGCKAKVNSVTLTCELGHRVMLDPSRRFTPDLKFKSRERCEKPTSYRQLDKLKGAAIGISR